VEVDAAIVRQQRGKHFSAAMNKHATIEDAVFTDSVINGKSHKNKCNSGFLRPFILCLLNEIKKQT
jgi:hypothetical protein